MHVDRRNHGLTYNAFEATYDEPACSPGSFRYNRGRYVRRCTLKYYPNDRTAALELPVEAPRLLDQRRAPVGPPATIHVGGSSAEIFSGDFLRKRHLCQKWAPRGAAPRSGSSILASPAMEASDFHSVPRAGKSVDFLYRMTLFECPMVELSGKKFTVHDSSAGAHRADASALELSDASLDIALSIAGRDWESCAHRGDEGDASHEDDEGTSKEEPGIEMGTDGYPIVWIKTTSKQGDTVSAEIKAYRTSYVRAALLLTSARAEARRKVRRRKRSK